MAGRISAEAFARALNQMGKLLFSAHFLPGFGFQASPLEVHVEGRETLLLALPKHSAARAVTRL